MIVRPPPPSQGTVMSLVAREPCSDETLKKSEAFAFELRRSKRQEQLSK
jgi:hypothetical protein